MPIVRAGTASAGGGLSNGRTIWSNAPALCPFFQTTFNRTPNEWYPPGLVTDSGFNDPSYFNLLQAGWSTGNGKLVGAGAVGYADKGLFGSITSGRDYIITFTVEGYSSGTVKAYVGGTPAFAPDVTADGTYSFTVTAVDSSGDFGFYSPDGFTGWIDRWQVVQVPVAAAYTLTADVGSYAITGTATGLKRGFGIPAAVGSYSITGTPTALRVARRLTEAVGSYTISGQTVALRVARRLALVPGAYAITGTATALRAARKLAEAVGSYAITGTATGLKAARSLAAAVGSYTINGQPVTLTYTPASVGYTLTASPGAYSITGNAANFVFLRVLVANSGAYAVTGVAAALKVGRRIVIVPGSYGITGSRVELIYSDLWKLNAESGGEVDWPEDLPTGTWTPEPANDGTWNNSSAATGTWTSAPASDGSWS